MMRAIQISISRLLPAAIVSIAAGIAQQLPPSGDPPNSLSWRAALVAADEPGEPLVISGTIYAADGSTPVAGAIMYLYQTDASGVYNREEGSWRRPRIRGWVKTDKNGRYEVRTIKPGSYPGSRTPAHIHATVRAPGGRERWIDEFHFDGDPHLSKQEIGRAGTGSFSSIMKMRKGKDGIIRCVRDIRLEPGK